MTGTRHAQKKAGRGDGGREDESLRRSRRKQGLPPLEYKDLVTGLHETLTATLTVRPTTDYLVRMSYEHGQENLPMDGSSVGSSNTSATHVVRVDCPHLADPEWEALQRLCNSHWGGGRSDNATHA
ncbi:hypothetical protein PHMEG_00040197, partial [Phytophthora megakarya]